MEKSTLPKPTKTEEFLFGTGLPVRKTAYEVSYSVPLQWAETYQEPLEPRPIDLTKPREWDSFGENWLAPSLQGEWFAHVLQNAHRVLDMGCGPGRPALYLAQVIPEIVGVEPGLTEIEHARKVQQHLDLTNVSLFEESALNLPFPDASFDGALFCYSLEATGDIAEALREAHRVLSPGGSLAVALAPIRRFERCQPAVLADGSDRPVLCYTSMTRDPITERRYRIDIVPESELGRRVRQSVLDARAGALLGLAEAGDLMRQDRQSVEAVEYFCVDGIRPEELRDTLHDLGFAQTAFWPLPSASAFAEELEVAGLLEGIRPEHHRAYLKALIRSCRTAEPVSDYVSAIKEDQAKMQKANNRVEATR